MRSTVYEFRVAGVVALDALVEMEGFTAVTEPAVTLVGPAVDQAALHGLIQRLAVSGVRCIEVRCIKMRRVDVGRVEVGNEPPSDRYRLGCQHESERRSGRRGGFPKGEWTLNSRAYTAAGRS